MMKILICTLFDLNVSCAGLNRIYRVRDALKPFGIDCITAGYGCSKGEWEYKDSQDDRKILFNSEVFSKIRHSNTLKFAAQAGNFYKNHLRELISKFKLSGLIIYSPQGEVVGKIIDIARQTDVFVVADCGEYYRFSIHNLLNGMIFQQALFKYFQMSKLDGVIVPSPPWLNRAIKLDLPRVLIPGISNSKSIYRIKPSSKTSNINIVFMGRLSNREVPNTIFNALVLCKRKNISFKFHVFGSRNEGYREKYWLKKLKNIPDLQDSTVVYGYVSDKARDSMLAKADIFIMLRPTNIETKHLFPSRVPEFLLSGNPVILSNTSPLNLFFQYEQGVKFISSSNHPKELANEICRLAKDPNYRFKIGQDGRKFALENFSGDVMGRKLFEFLDELQSSRH